MAKKKSKGKRGRPKGSGKTAAQKEREALAAEIGTAAVRLATDLAVNHGKEAIRYATLVSRSLKLKAKDQAFYEGMASIDEDKAEKWRQKKLAEAV